MPHCVLPAHAPAHRYAYRHVHSTMPPYSLPGCMDALCLYLSIESYLMAVLAAGQDLAEGLD